jgi:hypothetical protein
MIIASNEFHANAERVFVSARNAGMRRTCAPLPAHKRVSQGSGECQGCQTDSPSRVKNENRRKANPTAFTNQEHYEHDQCKSDYRTMLPVPQASMTT